MLRCIAVVLCCIVLSSSSTAFAQVVYQPVTYQYESGRGEKYFYGGTNPLVHQVAGYASYCPRYGYANNLHRFDGGNSFGQPSPLYDRTPVYTDCIPFQDASRFGYTAADARNEAYANSPTYFRKVDLLASAVPLPDGSFIVPFNAPTVSVMPYGAMRPTTATAPSTLPSAKKGQIIIIPKRLLDQKVKDLDTKPLKVVLAK